MKRRETGRAHMPLRDPFGVVAIIRRKAVGLGTAPATRSRR